MTETQNEVGQRPLRIASISGSVYDRGNGLENILSSSEKIDVCFGDWMSEGNMAAAVVRKLRLAAAPPGYEVGYEPSFITQVEPHLRELEKRGIKLVSNAGAVDTEELAIRVQQTIQSLGLSLKVAWVSGDVVTTEIEEAILEGSPELVDLETGKPLDNAPKILFAQAYLGGRGIKKALQNGANIVLCGRVADASPVIGSAAWWHDWKDDQFQELASAFVAGHLLECSTYVTGGNFSGFKTVPDINNLGYPIGEIGASGEILITKVEGTGGTVNEDTVTAQLLYEIQGTLYHNSDVTADISHINLTTVGTNRVKVEGVSGLPPPPTTKAGITAEGGYQAELHWSLVGLDTTEKARLAEAAIRISLGEDFLNQVSLFQCSTYGVVEENPSSQNAATVDFRILAQAPNKELLSHSKFVVPIYNTIMCTYPGGTMHPAATTAIPRIFCEYLVAMIPQNWVKHTVHFPHTKIEIPPPRITKVHPRRQVSYEPHEPIDSSSFGPTVSKPLGLIVHARSGDKGANANVGFWARSEKEYEWLKGLLTTKKMKELLGSEYKEGEDIDRVEFPGLRAVHFLLHNHLDRGVNSTSTYDILGKQVGEYLRAKWVDIPEAFLASGTI